MGWPGAEEDLDGCGHLGQRRMLTWTAWAEDVGGLVALKRTMTDDVKGLVAEDMRAQILAALKVFLFLFWVQSSPDLLFAHDTRSASRSEAEASLILFGWRIFMVGAFSSR